MLWQAPEAEVFPLCSANGISQIVWSPLAQGVLTGKYKPRRPLPADSRFASDAMNFAQDIVYNDEALEAAQRLVPVAQSAGLSLPTLALAWVLRRGEVACHICSERKHRCRKRLPVRCMTPPCMPSSNAPGQVAAPSRSRPSKATSCT
jgi:aryl-alcohol dehydrogenase-like predicted oxidoreductase